MSTEQIKLFIDALEVYPYISAKETASLIKRLNYFLPHTENKNFLDTSPKNMEYKISPKIQKSFIKNVSELTTFINQKTSCKIKYGSYHIDHTHQKVLIPRDTEPYTTIIPYQLMWSNGYYYLIALNPKYPDAPTNFRVDRIVDIIPDSENTLPYEPLRDPHYMDNDTFNASAYRAHHVVMFGGEIHDNIKLKFRKSNYAYNTIIDCFGTNVRIRETEDSAGSWLTVTLSSSLGGVALFATQYATDCIVVSPPELREKVIKNLTKGLENYAL